MEAEKLFADWIARDMGDAFIRSISLEKNSDGTFSQGMTRIKFNAFCAGLQSSSLKTEDKNLVSDLSFRKVSLIDESVNRFLRWRLPANFSPDCGVSFKPLNHPTAWPTGTNLLDGYQAKAMLLDVAEPLLTIIKSDNHDI